MNISGRLSPVLSYHAKPEPSRPDRAVMVGYAVVMMALTVTFYIQPGWHVAIWGLMGVATTGAVVRGVMGHRPDRRMPWLLMAGAILVFTVANTTYHLLDATSGYRPFPTPTDGFYLLIYPLLAAGLLGLSGSMNDGRDWGSLLDILTFASGVGLLVWLYMINPHARGTNRTTLEQCVAVGYPLGDMILLITVIRLVVVAFRGAAARALAVATLGLLASDVIYWVSELNGQWRLGLAGLGWFVFYAGSGIAALHPSMVVLTKPKPARTTEPSGKVILLLALVSLIAPTVLLIESIEGRAPNGAVIAVSSGVMFILVLMRLYGVGKHLRQSLARERALREASAALVSSTDVAGVTDAVRAAVARLVPPGSPHHVAISFSDHGKTSPGKDSPGRDGPGSVEVGGAGDPNSPNPRGLRMIHDGFDPSLAAQLAGFDAALECPFTVVSHPSGDLRAGTLTVAASESTLAYLPGLLETLTSQAALAIDRIALSDEVARISSEEYFRILVQQAADVILIVDEDDRVLYASPSANALFGVEPDGGVLLEDLFQPNDRELIGRSLDAMRRGNARTAGRDWTVSPDREGVRVQVEVSYRDLREDPSVGGLVITLRDVTEQRRLEGELTYLAFHDSLTGLPNRALFQDRLGQTVTRASRRHTIAGVLFIDLDDFKIVNDTMGHAAGDELLVAVGQRLTECVRPQDTAARLGGDEFAVLVDDVPAAAEVERVADRISAALAMPFPIGGQMVSGTGSIGVATTLEATNAEELRRQADLALYVAKSASNGRWRRYQPQLHTEFVRRAELRTALDQAVATGAFALRYQPIMDLATGEPVGFEALVRWRHPTRGLVAPGEFIDVAEDTGLIVPIGDWVLEHAFADAARWRAVREAANLAANPDAGHPTDPVASLTAGAGGIQYLGVNISVRQFHSVGFVQRLLHELDASGLPPSGLMLEITESLLLRDDEQVWADLVKLRERGIRVAIDDFGTGYSALSYLRQVPIDMLKIDRTFIDAITSSGQQRALVEGIIRLAHTLGLEVIAEGLEDLAQLELLRRAGCQFGQGYLFAKPLSYREATDWMASRNGRAAGNRTG